MNNFLTLLKKIKFILSESQKKILIECFHLFSIFLLNFVSYFYIFIKFFRVMCYSKMTFRVFPMINSRIWPFCIFHILTNKYFKFWQKILPPVSIKYTQMELHTFIAIEFINSLAYFCVSLAKNLIELIEKLELDLLN